MSEFWWGVLALPIIALSVAAAVAAGAGAWLLAEKWWERRWRKMEPVEFPQEVRAGFPLWTVGKLGMRGAVASIILSGGSVRMLKVGPAAIILAAGKPDREGVKKIQKALAAGLMQVAKEEQP